MNNAYKLLLTSLTITYGLIAMSAITANGQQTTYVNSAKTFCGPLTYKDPHTNVVYYVESDGRHVSAIRDDGTILWNRNPFDDAGLEPYRVENPKIACITAPLEWMTKRREGHFISISFDSSQGGIINTENGEFLFLGQD